MEQDELFYIGKILKPYGNEGHLTVSFDLDDSGILAQTESIFVDIDHERVPFFFESFEPLQGNKAIIRFLDVNSRETARPFTGRELYLPAGSIPEGDEDFFFRHEVMGYTVKDKNRGVIGTVTRVLSMPTQTVLEVTSGDREILIPAVDKIILKTDRKKKVLHIRAPEGLIDLYL